MPYSLLSRIAQWEVILFIGGMGILILLRLLTGEINTRYLLWGRREDGTRYFSPERVQLLMITLGAAARYLTAVLHDPYKFPEVSDEWLAVLGGSHILYLGGKLANTRFGKSLRNH